MIDRDRLNKAIEEMCENYCMWPVSATSDETLELHCKECPLRNLEKERDNG